MRPHINGVQIETLARAYELITNGGTIAGAAERFGIGYDRLRKALWVAKTKGIR